MFLSSSLSQCLAHQRVRKQTLPRNLRASYGIALASDKETDGWRFEVRLVAQTDYFTSKLAADLLELFSWPQERSNAALAFVSAMH